MEVTPLEPTGERDPMRNCAPVGTLGPRCSECASCIADTRAVENEFARERILELEAALSFYASEDIMMMIGGDRGDVARKVLKASSPTSGDRTESAPRSPVVEPGKTMADLSPKEDRIVTAMADAMEGAYRHLACSGWYRAALAHYRMHRAMMAELLREPPPRLSLWDPEAEKAASERQGGPHAGEEASEATAEPQTVKGLPDAS